VGHTGFNTFITSVNALELRCTANDNITFGNGTTERWRINGAGLFTSIGAGPNPSNVTGDGVILAEGGIGFTDVLNAWIDDATHGSGTVVHYIGNETIDTTASSRSLKENFMPVNGAARQHLTQLSGLLQEYDYQNGMGHFVGMVAEDVRDALLQYVVGDESPSLRYQYMVGPLLWGWQDHDERLAAVEEANRTIGATSDYRLKENDIVMSDGLTKINRLRPITFNWKDNPSVTRSGFFAHEVQAIIPEAVSGKKDAVEANGEIDPQTLDDSKIVPTLVAAIQELSAKILSLETRLKSLED